MLNKINANVLGMLGSICYDNQGTVLVNHPDSEIKKDAEGSVGVKNANGTSTKDKHGNTTITLAGNINAQVSTNGNYNIESKYGSISKSEGQFSFGLGDKANLVTDDKGNFTASISDVAKIAYQDEHFMLDSPKGGLGFGKDGSYSLDFKDKGSLSYDGKGNTSIGIGKNATITFDAQGNTSIGGKYGKINIDSTGKMSFGTNGNIGSAVSNNKTVANLINTAIGAGTAKKVDLSANNTKVTMSCHIVDLLTDETISFEVLPEEISDSISANWDTTSVRGRSAPYVGFVDVGARTISLSFHLYEGYCGGNIRDIVNKLKALAYPRYQGSLVIPASCFVRFGMMIGMYAVVDSVSVSWQKPYIQASNYAEAEVSMEFTQYIKGEIPNHDTVRQNGGNSFDR